MVLGIEWSASGFSPSFQFPHLEEWGDLSRWQNWEIQISLGSVPLSSSWGWASHRQQNFLSALPILWPQALGPALPVSEEVSLLIPGLGDQFTFKLRYLPMETLQKWWWCFWPPFWNPLFYMPIYLESRQEKSIIWLGLLRLGQEFKLPEGRDPVSFSVILSPVYSG